MAILMISRTRGGHIGLIFWEIDKEPGLPNTSGYADGHIVKMFVCITHREGVIAILVISRSRGGHIGITFWKLRGCRVGPGPPSTSGYADGHRVQMYVYIRNTEGVMAILMIP